MSPEGGWFGFEKHVRRLRAKELIQVFLAAHLPSTSRTRDLELGIRDVHEGTKTKDATRWACTLVATRDFI